MLLPSLEVNFEVQVLQCHKGIVEVDLHLMFAQGR